jgi:hypothetical protein
VHYAKKLGGKRRGDRSPREAEEAPQQILAGSLAKWLLPSVTVFVAIVGYIVQSAQQDMLGIGIELGETTTYFISAAKFMSDTGRLMAAPFIRLRLPLGGHWILIGLSTIAVLAVLLAPRLAQIRRFYRPAMLTGLLALLLLAKFLVLDVPLARVTNVVLGDPEKIDFATGNPLPIDHGGGASPTSLVDGYAKSLSDSIRCSRVNADQARLNAVLRESPECRKGKEYNSRRLIGEYYAQIWMMALILVVAGMVLHLRTGRQERMLALLGALYSLSIPYAYGKLIHSAFFDFGIVHLTAAPSADGQPPQPIQQSAVILSRGSGGASLLILQRTDCPGSKPEDPTRSALIARHWISASRIVSIEQIYSADVIKWAASNARYCAT